MSDYLEQYRRMQEEYDKTKSISPAYTDSRPLEVKKKKKQPKKYKPKVIGSKDPDASPLDFSAYLNVKQKAFDVSLKTDLVQKDRVLYQGVNVFNILKNVAPVPGKPLVYDMTFEEEKALCTKYKSALLVDRLQKYRATFSRDGVNLYTPYPNKFSKDQYDPDNFSFYNTQLVSLAANYFKKFHVYCSETAKTHPIHYKEFWDRWEYRRKNGIVLPIKGNNSGANSDRDLEYLWVPGKMVGMLNFGKMTRTTHEGIITEDNKLDFDCILNNGIDLQTSRGLDDDQLQSLFNQYSGNKVVSTEFDFPDFWDGHYMYWVANAFCRWMGLNEAMLKARRKGMTYIGAWDSFDEIDMYPRKKVLFIAFLEKYINGNNSLMKFCKDYHAFMSLHTDWSKKTLMNNQTRLEYGYSEEGRREPQGFRSSIECFTARDNPSCARGSQSNIIKYEECGSFDNVYETNESTTSSAESGGYTIGISSFWGTASTNAQEFSGFSRIIQSPKANKILAYDWGLYEDRYKGIATCSFFPQILNLEGGGMDAYGNSNLSQALNVYHKRWEDVKNFKSASDADKWAAERPLFPSQVLNISAENSFSGIKDLIMDQINYLEHDKGSYVDGQYRLNLDGVVELIPNSELTKQGVATHPFIYDMPAFLPRGYDLHGCIREYEPPIVIEEDTGEISQLGKSIKRKVTPPGIYYMFHDPYAVDKNEEDITLKDSLGVTYVFMIANRHDKAAVGRMVASWIGRPPLTEDYNHPLYLMARRYNTISGIMFESDRGEVVPYFKGKHALKYLAPEPMLLSFKGALGKALTGRGYGFSMGKHADRKREAVRMLLDYLKSSMLRVTGEDGLEIEVFRIRTIKCTLLLKQLLKFTYGGNFDAVSAWLVGMYLLREIEDVDINYNNQAVESGRKRTSKQSDFWKRN